MRLLMSVSLAFLLCAPSYLPQQTATGVIEGIVVNATTGEPVAGAQVALTSVNLSSGVPGTIDTSGAGGDTGVVRSTPAAAASVLAAQIPPVTTGSDGKFSFKQLRPSTYRVSAAANGYVRQGYGQRALNGQARPIYLGAGETFKDASIRLTPTGTLVGRIFDESGQPAVGVSVQLLRVFYNVQGKTYQSAGMANADDRGQYRIYGVTPGPYFLNAGSLPIAPSSALGAMRYEALYYPGVKDIDQASPIEIKSGSEVSMDMTLRRQPQTFRVRGKVIDSSTGTAPPNVNIGLNYRTLNSGGGSLGQRGYDPATGTFELQNVAPGDYVVQAQLPRQSLAGVVDAATAEAARAAQASLPSAQVPIRVMDSDVDGIVLTLRTAATVAGRITFEGQPISSVTNLDRVRFNLVPESGPTNPPALGLSPVVLAPRADGTFEIRGLREGDYRFMVNTPNPDYYVKSVQYGGDDILTKAFSFSGSPSGTIDVVFRKGSASLIGTVTNAQSQPVSGIQTVLIPVRLGRLEPYRTATTDQAGRFSMAGITPGDYRIFSWEAADNSAFYDPEFVKQYEQRGQLIHFAESASQSVDVKMIPAP